MLNFHVYPVAAVHPFWELFCS